MAYSFALNSNVDLLADVKARASVRLKIIPLVSYT